MTFDEWLAQEVNQGVADSTTLGPASNASTYLRNRLYAAFDAGREAGYVDGGRYEKDRIKTLLGLE